MDIPWPLLLFLWANSAAFIALTIKLCLRSEKAATDFCKRTETSVNALKDQYKALAESTATIHSSALTGIKENSHLLLKHDAVMHASHARLMDETLNNLVASQGHLQLKLMQTILLSQRGADGKNADPKALVEALERIAKQKIDLGKGNGRFGDEIERNKQGTVPPTLM